MLVHTPFRKSCECEMSTRIRLNLRSEIRDINKGVLCDGSRQNNFCWCERTT